MILFDYILDNDIIFYTLFASTAGFIGYKFVSSYLNSYYVDEGVQTEAWEDFSERASQIASDNLTSMETETPVSPIVTNISDTSTVTTILPVPPVNVEIVPNQDILVTSDINTIYSSKIQEISQLYQKELYDNVMTNSDLISLIKSFTIEQISASNFNEFVILFINCFNG